MTLTTGDVSVAGGIVSVQISGFAPNSQVVISLHSDPVIIGSFTTNNVGDAGVSFPLPSGLSGQHEIWAEGTDSDGTAVIAKGLISIDLPTPVSNASLAFTGNDPGMKVLAAGLLIVVGLLARRCSRSLAEATHK
jgi:hypothetical protein